jgi:hypothetical protein
MPPGPSVGMGEVAGVKASGWRSPGVRGGVSRAPVRHVHPAALMTGAILVVSGPAVVGTLLRFMRPSERLQP